MTEVVGIAIAGAQDDGTLTISEIPASRAASLKTVDTVGMTGPAGSDIVVTVSGHEPRESVADGDEPQIISSTITIGIAGRNTPQVPTLFCQILI
jgi:hypothetical protein